MTIRLIGGTSGLINDAAENVTATGTTFGNNITAATATLYLCSFSSAITITCTTLSADYATFRALLAAGATLTVTTFTPLFPRDIKTFGASTATSGQFLLTGGPSAVSTATEGAGQLMMPSSYAILAIVARSLTNSSTVTVRKGGADQALTCAPAANGNASDRAIGHMVTGNQNDLISVGVTGTAGGLVRASLEIVLL
jgi:hypothetical protein